MAGRRSFLLLLVVACSTHGIVEAGDRPPPGQVERAMTAAINDRLARSWADQGVEPAPRSSDSEFLRRASLDLGGKIPTVAEARSFLDDADPEKRRKVVERILQGPSATIHFTNIWRGLLVPGLSPINVRLVGADFDQLARRPVRRAEGLRSGRPRASHVSARQRLDRSPRRQPTEGHGDAACLLHSPRVQAGRPGFGDGSACSSASGSSAPSATTTPSPRGSVISSGSSPRTSAASPARGRRMSSTPASRSGRVGPNC